MAAKAVATAATDKRGRTAIATIVCSVLMLFFIPLIVYMGVVSNMGDFEIDTAQAKQIIVQNISAEEKNKLQHLEDVMNNIATEFQTRNLNNLTIKKAQAIYVCALYDIEPTDTDFIIHIADCFEKATDDNNLLSLINSTFGTQIKSEDFSHLLSVISSTVIDLNIPKEKTNLGLVEWANFAYENKWGYVYGSHGDVLTESRLKYLKGIFGRHITDYESFIRANWMGRRTADCVGLIKGYGWYDNDSGTIKVGTNGMADVTANGMYQAAVEKGTIGTMPDLPGIAVWHEGHIGVYIGNGYVIHAANTRAGVIKTPITQSGWTHWLKIPYINYIDESEVQE